MLPYDTIAKSTSNWLNIPLLYQSIVEKMQKKTSTKRHIQLQSRREFTRLFMASPLWGAAGLAALGHEYYWADGHILSSVDDATNVLQFEGVARTNLSQEMYYWIADGADDRKTLHANREAFDDLQIRARRLVDVSGLTTKTEILGEQMDTPILIAPIGRQELMHPDGELATARAAVPNKHVMIVSTGSSYSFTDIARAGGGPCWFQLYPSLSENVTLLLLDRASEAGAKVVVLTVDGPIIGNRERENLASRQRNGPLPGRFGNFEGLEGPFQGASNPLTWDFLKWLRAATDLKIVLKGIVTLEDARLCVENGADGLIVSNHGGRQEESLRGTIESLPEVVDAIGGRLPVLIDGGFRRGTDIFKALALGADGVCIGRPHVWGLSAFGEDGVAKVLDLLRAELVRIMQFTGTTSLKDISPVHITRRT